MIKKRNLDDSLIQWIMTATGLGPGVGKIKYVAPDASATSQFRTQLESMGVSSGDIHTLPSLAYDAMVTARNDIMLVAPGAYAETVELAWDLNNTHALGLAGPVMSTDYSEPGVCIYTSTAAVAETVDLTGNYCQFHGINFTNCGNNAGNLAAFNVDGYGAYFKSCSFQGVMTAGQDDVVAAASLYIDGLGCHYLFENCQIGQNLWDVREGANSGMLRYVATAGYPTSQNGRFRNCDFLSRSETVTVALVAIPHLYAISHIHTFERCDFSNVSTNWGNSLNQVFYNPNLQTCTVRLIDCTMTGFDAWQDSNYYTVYQSNMPATGTSGGIMAEPTGGQ